MNSITKVPYFCALLLITSGCLETDTTMGINEEVKSSVTKRSPANIRNTPNILAPTFSFPIPEFDGVYGAKPDQGETDDPLVDSVTYQGNVYYIDCENGDDTNIGTTPLSAWKTLNKSSEKFSLGYWDTVGPNINTYPPNHAAWTAAPTGSAFLYKRGCTFDGFINYSPYEKIGSNPSVINQNFTFGAYGDKSRPRPIIQYITSSPVFYGNYVRGNGHKFNIRNLHFKANPQVSSTGMFLNNSDGITIENSVIEDMSRDGITADNVKNLTIKNCLFINNQNGGGRGGGLAGSGENIQVLNSTFVNNGRDQIGAHNIYLRHLHSALVKGNLITQGSNMGIVIHGANSNVLIEDNDIYGNSNGLSLSSGYYSGEIEQQDLMVVNRNKIHDNGFRQGEQGYAMLLDTMTNSIITNNITYGNKLGGVQLAEGPQKDVPSSNNKILHNLFYEKANYALSFDGARLGNTEVKNNIIINPTFGKQSLVISSNVNLVNINLNYNLYYSLQNTNMIKIGSTYYNPASLAISSLGFEVNGKNADPQFLDLVNNKFELVATSPAKNAGVNASVASDFKGNTRSVISPSIGPFE